MFVRFGTFVCSVLVWLTMFVASIYERLLTSKIEVKWKRKQKKNFKGAFMFAQIMRAVICSKQFGFFTSLNFPLGHYSRQLQLLLRLKVPSIQLQPSRIKSRWSSIITICLDFNGISMISFYETIYKPFCKANLLIYTGYNQCNVQLCQILSKTIEDERLEMENDGVHFKKITCSSPTIIYMARNYSCARYNLAIME